MPKTPTRAALCAKAIRKELKEHFPKSKFKVTSENYSMGDNVNVSWFNGPTSQQVNQVITKYQYGHVNSMEDIYEHSNNIEDLPQAKYVSPSRKLTAEGFCYMAALLEQKYHVEIPIEIIYDDYYQRDMAHLKDQNQLLMDKYISDMIHQVSYKTPLNFK